MRLWLRLIGTWIAIGTSGVRARKNLMREEARQHLEASNPDLLAARAGVQESRAEEIPAYLRPDLDLTLSVDQIDVQSALVNLRAANIRCWISRRLNRTAAAYNSIISTWRESTRPPASQLNLAVGREVIR
jgi:hypothetical protein